MCSGPLTSWAGSVATSSGILSRHEVTCCYCSKWKAITTSSGMLSLYEVTCCYCSKVKSCPYIMWHAVATLSGMLLLYQVANTGVTVLEHLGALAISRVLRLAPQVDVRKWARLQCGQYACKELPVHTAAWSSNTCWLPRSLKLASISG